MRCAHRKGEGSTLQVAYTTFDGTTYWFARCTVCGKHTEPCLTVGEAIARACKEHWMNAKAVG